MSGRALGYRLLGRGFDYLLLTRPLEWPLLALHLLTGAALGGAVLQASVASGVLVFVLGLNAGTLALNSAFDRDRGDIAYLRSPPPAPPGLAVFGLGLMLVGLALAILLLPQRFVTVYGVCLVLSVLYSVPPLRLKARAGWDWAVNLAGFGFLTPYAGWVLSGRPVTEQGGVILVAFALLFGALYPLTQLYQLAEDRAKGDRTLAVALGVDWTLRLALLLAGAAFSGFFLAASWSAWTGGWRWLALVAAALAWVAVLFPWWLARARADSALHRRLLNRALGAWAVTDLAVLAAWAF